MKIRSAGLIGFFCAASAFAVSARVPGGGDRENVDASAFHPKTVKVAVAKDDLTPSSIRAEKGSPLTLVFTCTDDRGGGNKVVFPSLNITRDLPLGEPVTVGIAPDRSGEIPFSCGMGMLKGGAY